MVSLPKHCGNFLISFLDQTSSKRSKRHICFSVFRLPLPM
jgi:hypothetical protein